MSCSPAPLPRSIWLLMTGRKKALSFRRGPRRKDNASTTEQDYPRQAGTLHFMLFNAITAPPTSPFSESACSCRLRCGLPSQLFISAQWFSTVP